MTYTINIPDHHGSTFTREETEWPVFNGQEYCGQIQLIRAWAVPAGTHAELGFSGRTDIDLFLTPKGQWASTLEHAEHRLINEAAPTEFRVKGACLGLFVPGEWAEDNGTPNKYEDYRVFQRSPGFWDAKEIEEPPVMIGAYEPF